MNKYKDDTTVITKKNKWNKYSVVQSEVALYKRHSKIYLSPNSTIMFKGSTNVFYGMTTRKRETETRMYQKNVAIPVPVKNQVYFMSTGEVTTESDETYQTGLNSASQFHANSKLSLHDASKVTFHLDPASVHIVIFFELTSGTEKSYEVLNGSSYDLLRGAYFILNQDVKISFDRKTICTYQRTFMVSPGVIYTNETDRPRTMIPKNQV